MSPVLLPDVLLPEAAGLSQPSGPVLAVLVVAVVVEVGGWRPRPCGAGGARPLSA